MKNKIRLNTIVMVIAPLTGILSNVSGKEWFTSRSLVETILIIAPLLYFSIKYAASQIINKYQQYGYFPSKATRRYDDIFTSISFQVILPLCLDFAYACLVLFIVKSLSPASLPILADWILKIWSYNETQIASPLKRLVLILSLLTLFRIISLKYVKRFRSVFKLINLPLKFIAILLLFINVDTGTISKTLEWKLRAYAPTLKDGEIPTFNAAEKENIKEIVNAYADLITHQIVSQEHSSQTSIVDSIPANVFINDIANVLEYDAKEPTIKEDIYSGKGVPSENRKLFWEKLTEKDKAELKNFFETSYVLHSENPSTVAAVDLSLDSRIVANASEKKKSFLNIILDVKTEINERELSPSEEILRELLGDYLADQLLITPLKNHIAFNSFATDKTFDLLKEKALDGFSFLIQQAKSGVIRRSDVRMVVESMKLVYKRPKQKIIEHIANAKQLLTNFAKDCYTAFKSKTAFYEAADPSLAQIERFINLFPNDANLEYYQNLLDIKKINQDGTGIEKVNFAYWKKFISESTAGADREKLQEAYSKLEQTHDIILATQTQTSEAWVELGQKYPELAKNESVIQRIKALTEVEDAQAAESQGTTEAWNNYLEKYPQSSIAPGIRSSMAQGEIYHIPSGTSEIVFGHYARTLPPVIMEKPNIWKKAWSVLKRIRP